MFNFTKSYVLSLKSVLFFNMMLHRFIPLVVISSIEKKIELQDG